MFKSGKPGWHKRDEKVENPVENKNKIVEKRKTRAPTSPFSQNDQQVSPSVSPAILAI